MDGMIIIKGLASQDMIKILEFLDKEIRYEHFRGTLEINVKEA
jgi:hypothetical protein